MTTTDTLYALGYHARICGPVVLLTNPQGREYRIDPAACSCSCPASVACKHLRGWFQLLQQQADAICYEMMTVDDAGPGCREGSAYTALGFERRRLQLALSERAFRLRLAADALLAVGAREERIAA